MHASDKVKSRISPLDRKGDFFFFSVHLICNMRVPRVLFCINLIDITHTNPTYTYATQSKARSQGNRRMQRQDRSFSVHPTSQPAPAMQERTAAVLSAVT